MRALTVRQPWAWAIVHGGKDVENRTRNVAGSYRGPVAIHAGKTLDTGALLDPMLRQALPRDASSAKAAFDGRYVRGALLGVVDLVDVHEGVCDGDTPPHGVCCPSPWAQFPYLDRGDGRGFRPLGQHLVLANPRPLEVPIQARGMLGLWTPPPVVLEQLQAVTR